MCKLHMFLISMLELLDDLEWSAIERIHVISLKLEERVSMEV